MFKQMRLPYRIKLIRPGRVPGSRQFEQRVTYDYADDSNSSEAFPVSANLLVSQGTEQSVEGVVVPSGVRKFVIRKRKDVNLGWRVEFDSKLLALQDISPYVQGARNQFVVLTCEAATSNA